MLDPASFGAVCTTWGQTCNLWSKCIAAVVEEVFGGARDPQYWHDPPFYEELDKYQERHPDKSDLLIKIYVKCANKKYKNEFKLPKKKIKVTVDDVQFILTTLKEVGVDVKNIRNYNDNDLNNLLD